MILIVAHHWLGTWNVYNYGYVDQPFNLLSLEAEGHRSSSRCSNTLEQNTIARSRTTHGMHNAMYTYAHTSARAAALRASAWAKSTANGKPRPTTSSTWSKCTRLSPSLFIFRACPGRAWFEANWGCNNYYDASTNLNVRLLFYRTPFNYCK